MCADMILVIFYKFDATNLANLWQMGVERMVGVFKKPVDTLYMYI